VSTKLNGVPIRINDIANVHLGPNMRRGIAEYNGKGEVVGGIVVMRFGENALGVIDDVKKKLKEVEKSLPEGVEIVPVYDRSNLILRSINNLKETLIEEFIASALIVILFLFHFRSAFIGILTLPLAMIATFIPMYFLGVNANIMSLAGIGIAIGDMVDSAIVMVENAHKHLEKWEMEGKKIPRIEVIINSAKEVGPTLFSALLIIAVSFLPIFALEAQEGKLFKPLAITKTLAMFFASFLAITVTPALMVIFIKGKIVKEKDNPVNKFLLVTYEPIVRFVIKNPYKMIIISFLFFVFSLPIATKIGTEFMPPLNEGTLLYMPTTLPGIGVSEATRITHIQDKLIMKVPEVESVFGKIGRADTSTDPAPLEMWETIVNLKPKEKWRPGITWEKIVEELNNAVQIPGIVNAWIMPIKTRIDMLTTGVKTPLGIKIYGPDLKTIEQIGQHIEMLMKKIQGTRSAYSERTGSGYYIEIDINRELIARHGLTIKDVELHVQSALGGEEITTTIEGKERYTVNVRYPREVRDSPEKIKSVYLISSNGYQIPLSQVANVRLVKGPSQIRDENGSLVGYVYVDIKGIDIGTYVKNAKKLLDTELKLPIGYTIEFAGQYEYIQRMYKKLTLLIPLTVFIIFLFCYFNFNSVAKTLMVMLYIPFAVTGGVWYLFLNGFNFSMAVAVGFIALAGMSIETAMVMIVFLDEAIERFKKEGRLNTINDLKEAVIEGAVRRLRPKLMTIATDVAAFLPIMFSAGTGADVMQRMAAPLIGGTVTSTIVVLGILPAVYYLWRIKELKLTT
jgi:Cu(I)/Ag(I) efflux system membrane protein CusA/SilA